METIDILKNSSLFNSLDEKITKRFAERCEERTFNKQDYLINQGQTIEYCYIITEGAVEVFQNSTVGGRRSLSILGKNDIIGELSMIDGLPCSANVIALKDTNTLAICTTDFREQLQTNPEIALQILPQLSKRLRVIQSDLYI